MNRTVVVVAAKRTPVGSFLGSLSSLSAPQLGAAAIRALLAETGLPAEQIDEVMMGNVLTAGVGQNPARQAAIAAGIPEHVPAVTVNAVCGSGLYAIRQAVQSIACGDNDIVIAGGQESMSQAPHFVSLRQGRKMGDAPLADSMVADGLTDVYHGYHMGITAENVAEKTGIGRAEQDAFALQSQQRAAAARAEGRFRDEIVPVEIPQRKGGMLTVSEDEYIKADASAEAVAKLRPAFKADGTVTAANASGLNDGAAAVLLMSARKAAELGLRPLAAVKATAAAGIAPEIMGLGPVPAMRRALAQSGWQVGELDLVEANEAFAAQALGVCRELGLDPAKTNVNGGAIAIGHPIGASGCRIVVTLLHEMQRRGVRKGAATLCIGGGMGVAATFERE
ncbi:acetyl-CoA C-acetyltransferase [Neisseria leonii]|uniref:Acetyl-CoA C-acetyltransferase n=1 Tax=Neisseria leonii TaxID=2995413 RepID=A0A9X4E3J1_9NEIS|nr:acetyl-CoA C-acetyltransferase [Neisseria sp. 51.81]MDD9328559.1 acetyl-CoA C-acetyltransferase [Neisseria sp. 51.81]